jgi:MFS family permease
VGELARHDLAVEPLGLLGVPADKAGRVAHLAARLANRLAHLLCHQLTERGLVHQYQVVPALQGRDALALGSVSGGLLAAIDVVLPFLVAGLVLLITLGIVLTFTEPQTAEPSDTQARPSFGMVICSSLLGLAALQVLPALLIAVMGFLTAVVRRILVSRIQDELSDDIRATMLSMQSLTFTIVAAMSQPTLGAVVDHWGLPAAYVALAATVSLLMVGLFWKSRQHCPQPVMVPCPAQVLEPHQRVAE